jgi:hypothetical protein
VQRFRLQLAKALGQLKKPWILRVLPSSLRSRVDLKVRLVLETVTLHFENAREEVVAIVPSTELLVKVQISWPVAIKWLP